MSKGELILYRTDDGRAEVQLHVEGDSAWLTPAEMAELFDTSRQNVSLHGRNILAEGELGRHSVVKDSLTTHGDARCRPMRTPPAMLPLTW